jgi:hypothetical protein
VLATAAYSSSNNSNTGSDNNLATVHPLLLKICFQ